MPADLFVYALVAAGLVFWLRSVLGTRHGEERERSNPFLSGEAPAESEKTAVHTLPLENMPESAEERVISLAKEPRKNCSIAGKSAETGLIEIARSDKGFDIDFFLQGAQDAFVMIVEAFAKGERATLEGLLSPQVYKAFEGAITEREKRGETQATDIHAIRKAEVVEARLDGKTAFITVKFTAEEASVTRDKDGMTIAGNPDRTVTMHDVWTFGRALRSKDPAWLVYETRGDFDGDNTLIPDTH